MVLWKKIFFNWKYVILLFGVAFIFYVLNVVISTLSVFNYFYKQHGFFATLKLILETIGRFDNTILLSSVVTLVTLSILTGIMITLLAYNYSLAQKNTKNSTSIVTSIGLFLGIFAPGCVSCGIGLAAFFGLTTVLASLPFQGREISVVAIALLSFSIGRTSWNIANPKPCKVDFDKHAHIMKGGYTK